MERTNFKSSNILSAGYDPESKLLEVEYKTGLYRYHDVPEEKWKALQKAESKGGFIAAKIKPLHKCVKV